MKENERFPLRVEEIFSAVMGEWRVGEEIPPRLCENWQLVYVRSGAVEETADDRTVLLRAGALLFHQPNETHGMRAIGEVPPEVLRVEFETSGTAMDFFRGRSLRTATAEKNCLRQLAESADELFVPDAQDGQPPRGEPPFAAAQLAAISLETLLILIYRRLSRAHRPSPRAAAEQKQAALVQAVEVYFSKSLNRDLKLDEVCRANECGRVQLQQAFRAQTRLAPMEYFARMRLERAGQLLAMGYTPGEVAARLGYSSGAYFSQRFAATVGITPSAYRKKPYLLQLCNK